MKLKNPFSEETRNLYLYEYACAKCGRSGNLELHHILGRISNSPFNACLLCHDCHEHVSYKDSAYLFGYNMNFLLREHYKPTEDDYQFMRDNARKLGLLNANTNTIQTPVGEQSVAG